MIRFKNWLPAFTSLVLALTIAISGTIAYFTATDTQVNDFEFGSVEIELNEPAWDPTGATNVWPNREIPKDPDVTSTGKSNLVAFVKVTVPVRNVTLIADDGTAESATEPQEVFYMKLLSDPISVHENHFNAKWKHLPDQDEGKDMSGNSRTYVFGYSEVLKPGETTEKLFEKVQIKNTVEREIGAEELLAIQIDTYALQADGFITNEHDPENMSVELLNYMYTVYMQDNKLLP